MPVHTVFHLFSLLSCFGVIKSIYFTISQVFCFFLFIVIARITGHYWRGRLFWPPLSFPRQQNGRPKVLSIGWPEPSPCPFISLLHPTCSWKEMWVGPLCFHLCSHHIHLTEKSKLFHLSSYQTGWSISYHHWLFLWCERSLSINVLNVVKMTWNDPPPEMLWDSHTPYSLESFIFNRVQQPPWTLFWYLLSKCL